MGFALKVYFTVIIGASIGIFVFLCSILFEQYRKFCIKRLEYSRYFSAEGVFEGEEVFLIEEIVNKSIIPMFKVEVETFINSNIRLLGYEGEADNTQRFLSSFFIMPRTRIRRRHKAICDKRGYYELESAKINVSGLDEYVDSYARLYVYPKELEFDEINNINNYLQYGGASNIPIIKDAFEYAGAREYTYGDPMNMINHKATARAGKLMVNAQEYIMGRKIQMYINFQMPEDRYQSIEEFNYVMEKSMSYVSYMAAWSASNGYMFGVSANCKTVNDKLHIRFQSATGMTEYREMLKELAGCRNIYGISINTLMDMDIYDAITETEIYLFTTFVDESIEKRMEQFERLGNTVKVICL